MRLGINAGFGDPIGRETLAFIADLGVTVVRQDVPFEIDDAKLTQIVADFAGARVMPLFLLAGGKIQLVDRSRRVEPDELAALARRVVAEASRQALPALSIEVGNEPDIAHPGYADRPQDFAIGIQQVAGAVRDAGFTGELITGGVSNLNSRGLTYLEHMIAAGIPQEVTVGFHRYPQGMNAREPHDGFSSREDEWQHLVRLTGSHPLACTEFGHHTGIRRVGGLIKHDARISEQDAASDVQFDLEFFRNHRCPLSVLYQLNDGPNRDTPDDNYGVRRLDGSTKPAAAVLGSEAQRVTT